MVELSFTEYIDFYQEEVAQYDKFPVIYQFDFIKYHKLIKKYLIKNNLKSVYQIPKKDRWKIKGFCYVRDNIGAKIRIESKFYHRYSTLIKLNKLIYKIFYDKDKKTETEILETPLEENKQQSDNQQLCLNISSDYKKKREYYKKSYTQNELIFYPDIEEMQAELDLFKNCSLQIRLIQHLNYLKLYKYIISILFYKERVGL